MTDKILSRREDGVGHVVFNNPDKRNAVSLDMWQAVDQALERFANDEEVRVVVLSGAGGKAFVSGADVSKFEEERSGAEAVAHYNATTARIYAKLHTFAKPTIAQITGSCVGGGVALAVCCDLRICGQSSRFGIPAAKLGLGYGFGGLQRLVHLIGPAFAKEMFFTARLFSAAEAYEMGLVNRVVPDDQLESYVTEYARTITANAPLTMGSVKAIVGEILKDQDARDLAKCEELVRRCFASRDYAEGRQAFLEKRPPRFIGA
jgi:enoyl-CoA hydratase/carnithine racemase